MNVWARGADGVFLVVGVLWAGCISEGNRALGDARDMVDTGTSEPDVSEPETSDDDTIAPDVPWVDGSEDGAGPETSACEIDEDCDSRPEDICYAWLCVNGICEDQPLSGNWCDDGNVCTENDYCDQGTCVEGFPIDCAELSPECWSSAGDTCDPQAGCPGTPKPAGAVCDDGANLPGGTCDNGWSIPFDLCNGGGGCGDRSYLVPSGIHPLAGAWHAVISTVANVGRHETLRADLAFGQFGGLDANNVDSTDALWGLGFGSQLTAGSYCAEIDGPFTFNRGEHWFSGFSDPTRSIMVFGSEEAEGLGVAIRPTGEPDAVHGGYRVVYTAQYGLRVSALTTWQGTMEFDAGCLVSGSVATTPGLGARYDIVHDPAGSCFVRDGGLWALDVTYVADDGTSFPTRFAGAIGPAGDILLLTRELGRLEYGTVLLVRDRDEATVESMTGPWSFFSQRGGLTNSSQITTKTTSENGYFELGDGYGSIGGVAYGPDGDDLLAGEWWFTSTDGQYSQRASIGEAVLHHTGFIAPNDNVMFAWLVQAPQSNASEPQALRLAPIEGSLFVALRLLPFAD